MLVEYRTTQLQSVCTDARVASRTYGDVMARRIHARIKQLQTASNVEELIRLRIGRCHPLKGDRAGQYALDLVHPMRMIFIVLNGEIQIASIQEIVDYH